jgi:riboflavin biosynthesis pyrimidine reductase
MTQLSQSMIMPLTIRPATDIRGSVLAMQAPEIFGPGHDRVIANMVIGSNGATSLGNHSAPLSPPADRKRFHQIRSLASALVVGGRTYRSEHYENAPLPVFVATRDPELLVRNSGPGAHSKFFKLSPGDVLQIAVDSQKNPVLVEGGLSFLLTLLKSRKIDRLFLTRSPIAGDNDYFDFETLNQNYEICGSETIEGVTFEQWRPKTLQS